MWTSIRHAIAQGSYTLANHLLNPQRNQDLILIVVTSSAEAKLKTACGIGLLLDRIHGVGKLESTLIPVEEARTLFLI